MIESNYFKNRGINTKHYVGYKIPSYLNEYLKNEDSILDIGCGYGQMLLALKKERYKNIFGIDIDPGVVKVCKNKGLKVEQINSIDEYAKKT